MRKTGRLPNANWKNGRASAKTNCHHRKYYPYHLDPDYDDETEKDDDDGDGWWRK